MWDKILGNKARAKTESWIEWKSEFSRVMFSRGDVWFKSAEWTTENWQSLMRTDPSQGHGIVEDFRSSVFFGIKIVFKWETNIWVPKIQAINIARKAVNLPPLWDKHGQTQK